MFAKIHTRGKNGHWLFELFRGRFQGLLPKICRLIGVFVREQLGPRENGEKEMELKRKDADASPRQLHLGAPLWTAPRSFCKKVWFGSRQGQASQRIAPQKRAGESDEWLCRGARKAFTVSSYSEHPIPPVKARLWGSV
jgi:hypothetical protein